MVSQGFGSRLRKLREGRGLTQRELAERIEMEVAQVTRYERGQALPNAETLASLARILDVSLDLLLLGQEPDHPRPAEAPVLDLPLLERFRDVQKLSKRDREAVLLLIDSVLARNDVESRLRRRAS